MDDSISIEFLKSHISSSSHIPIEENETMNAKVILIGDSSVGKTSIIFRLMQDEFLDNPNITLGLELSIKKIMTNHNQMIVLNIWDSAGQEKYRSLTYHFYRGVNGILLVFDINNEQSLKNLHLWISQIYKYAPENVDIILIGNKCDEGHMEKNNEIYNIVQKYRLNFFETSAKTGKNIYKAFNFLAELIASRLKVESIIRKETSLNSPLKKLIRYDKKKEDSVILKLDKYPSQKESQSRCCRF